MTESTKCWLLDLLADYRRIMEARVVDLHPDDAAATRAKYAAARRLIEQGHEEPRS